MKLEAFYGRRPCCPSCSTTFNPRDRVIQEISFGIYIMLQAGALQCFDTATAVKWRLAYRLLIVAKIAMAEQASPSASSTSLL